MNKHLTMNKYLPMKEYTVKNFYLVGKAIKAKNETTAEVLITKAILSGEFEFDVEEVEK